MHPPKTIVFLLLIFITTSCFANLADHPISNKLALGLDIGRPLKFAIFKNIVNPEIITRYSMSRNFYVQNVFGASFFNETRDTIQFIKQKAFYTKVGFHYFSPKGRHSVNPHNNFWSVGLNLGVCKTYNEGNLRLLGPILTPYFHHFKQQTVLIMTEIELNYTVFNIGNFQCNLNHKLGGFLNTNNTKFRREFGPFPFAGLVLDKQTYASILGFNLMYNVK